MPEAPTGEPGRLSDNIMHFARVLRATGMPVGPGKVLDAIVAVSAVGLRSRQDLYWTLHAVFVNHPRQRELFDQAFHIFWRNPQLLERMMSLVLPEFRVPADDENSEELSKRLTDALYPQGSDKQTPETELVEEEFQATLTWSASERLQSMDFESMSAQEILEAQRAIARMDLDVDDIPTRRYRQGPSGRVDMRATLRNAMRRPGHGIPLMHRERRYRPPSIVVLCDISGSMSQYSRMVLHFVHAVTSARDRVSSFVFGTRLTNITRLLRSKDVDVALTNVSEAVEDWSGGTRIGECLSDFNRHWGRRVLAQGAVVLLISDGLDRDAGEGLELQMQRLHRSCRRLIWLNPLLRYDGYEPRTLGTRAMLPHVDDFRTIHSLQSMQDLADVLGRSVEQSRTETGQWQRMMSDNG